VGRRLLVLCCAGLLWTAPAHADTGILALGDFGVGGTTEREMGAAMKTFESNHPAQLLVTLGDNDYTESPRAFHRNWTAGFGWLGGAGLGVAGTLGNHDIRVNDGRYEYDELNMPRAHYRRTVGNVELFILNSNRVNSIQTTWLKKVLPASTAVFQVVVFHHPAWTCGEYRSNAATRRTWVPLFEQHGVDLVLNGHDHNYQRFARRHGVRYVVHGGGGAHLYPIESCPAWYPTRKFARAVRGFLYLRATDEVLRVYSVTRRRRIIDQIAIYP
jgi:hypothetical protein